MNFKRSTFCVNCTCVEVALTPRWVLVRDSKDPDGATLRFTSEEWAEFLRGAKAEEFDS